FRAALRALPHVGPGRSLSFVTLPAGQDPDDLVRAKGRSALEELFEKAEPLVDRIWHHELAAEPLDTPEQRAGLRRRLTDHASAITDADVRDQYRLELLRRFGELNRPPPRAPFQPFQPRRDWQKGKGTKSRFEPYRPVSEQAKALAIAGLDPRWLRAVLAGLLRYPQVVTDHSDAVQALPFLDRGAEKLRDALVSAAFLHGALDPDGLNTILIDVGAAPLAEELRQERGLAFSFTRRDADPERALRDLVLVIDTLAARPGLMSALDAATARLMESGDEAAFVEQQRLREARDEAERQLAALIEGDAG
ncbi:MAG TPA: DNA primase, partial [Allosphingosinicella sp.]